jgi:FHA domain
VSGRPWTTLVCWNCDQESANPGNSECLRCGKRLVPPRLVLKFEFGATVELDRGESAELGREGPYARLFRDSFPNVSRRHARVGVEPDGRAWIEPRLTPNGTFRGADAKEAELEPEVRYPLQPDDQLRFALHAKASVILYALPDS